MANVLIVDNGTSNRDFLKTLLGYRGHRVIEASDGAEALALVKVERADLVIGDIPMPTIDGCDFVRKLHAEPETAQVPVIINTAHFLDREAKAVAEDCGVSQIIYKPAEPEAVLREIDAALGLASTAVSLKPEESARESLHWLEEKPEELKRVKQRLEVLIDLGQQMTAERDPLYLLESCCHSARKIIGAKYAAIFVLDGEQKAPFHFFTSGMTNERAAHIGSLPVGTGVLDFLLSDGGRIRVRDIAKHPSAGRFPASHPGLTSFLGAAIRSSRKIYGALYLTDKIDLEEFTDEDEKLIATLVAQVGIAFENARLFEEVLRSAAELEDRVDARTAQLKDANKQLESFSYSISHDLRTPLRHIHGFAHLLQEHADSSLDETSRRYARTITEATKQMSCLCDDLLAFLKMERAEFLTTVVSFDQLAKQVIADLESYTGRQNITWKLGYLPDVQGDPAMLRLVLMNLLSNAVKYTGTRNEACIEIGSFNDRPGETVFFVRDNGVGFDMRFVNKLFGVFQRLHRSDEFEGTGIGLASVQRIVHRHGGTAWAEGVIDGGATFYFSLPRTKRSPKDEVRQ